MRLLFLHVLAAAAASAFVVSPPHMWTKLILTQHWPKTFCEMEHCHSNISSWTLHGLWPDKGMNCNPSWHFNKSQIEDLLEDMDKSWPDLISPKSPEFWGYEWHKHGTCAARAESLNSQHKYFSKALELYHKADLDSVLKKFGIVPSKQYYKFAHIEEVIDSFFGIKSKIQCTHQSKNSDYQILGQIEICFAPDFSLMNCEKESNKNSSLKAEVTSGYSVCDPDVPVLYPPMI